MTKRKPTNLKQGSPVMPAAPVAAPPAYRFTAWFMEEWSRTALPLGIVLLLLTPFMLSGLDIVAFLVFLQLPIYMLHQYEEHAQGRFREFVNQEVAGGREVLTNRAIFWINILGVWLLDLVILYVAQFPAPLLGLIAIYLTLFNSLLHIAMGIRLRRYNPGLWTSLLLFLPVGGYSLYVISVIAKATWFDQGIGLSAAILLHGLIFLYIGRKLRAG
ncbi:MAG: HXXEE domain-containing protein [Chloroflexi bacterium]|nr:HXXEE domain-containing protein [Chloroflexota bacterium]